MSSTSIGRIAPLLAVAIAALHAGALAQSTAASQTLPAVSYADLADLTQQADIVALVEVRKQTTVRPERAPGLAPGKARLYIEARTLALLASRAAVGESQVYLVDLPLDAKGKPPKLKKQRFIVYADQVSGRPGELSLVSNGAQIAGTLPNEQLARTVVAAFSAPDTPPAITGVRDIMSVAGNLAGESETQLFLDTETGAPVSITVVRRPGMAPEWGVSWSEIVDQAARPPAPATAAWYRLACFLPAQLPGEAFLQADRASRSRAEADYRYILDQLGDCPRTLGGI